MTILRGILVSAIMLAVAPLMALAYGDPRLWPLVCLLALVPMIQGLASPAMAHLVRAINHRPQAIIQVIAKLPVSRESGMILLGCNWPLCAASS